MTDGADGMSILITGLGGQGVMLASRAIALTATRKFPFVSRTESRGLSQRGGSVWSEVRFANRNLATSMGKGQCDLLLSLDCLEAMRFSDQVSPTGHIVTNRASVMPMYLVRREPSDHAAGQAISSFNTHMESLAGEVDRCVMLDLNRIASQYDYAKGLNLVLLGFATAMLPLAQEDLLDCALQQVPGVFHERAIETFRAGQREALRTQRMPAIAAA